jgi:enoyl-CoA hydratase
MNFPSYATLALEMVEPHVLVIRLNRPEVANAINTQMGHDMLDLWRRLTDDAGDVRCATRSSAQAAI